MTLGRTRASDGFDMFHSPPNKRNRAGMFPASAPAPIPKTVEVMNAQGHIASDAISLHCAVLHVPAELRRVSVNDRKSKQDVYVPVTNILLCDNGGPIQLELWREVAERVWNDLVKWSNSANSRIYVRLEYAWVRNLGNDYTMPSVPAVKKLHGNSRTRLVLSDSISQSSAQSLATRLYSCDFNVLSATPPFIVSLAGYVSSVEEERLSETGNPTRTFFLQDDAGRYATCVAVGRHVDNAALTPNNQVVMYFAKASPGRGGNPGQLMVYDDAHVVALSQNADVGSPRTCMELR